QGKEVLRRKLKQLKITLNESSTNELVRFFKLKTSLDLFYRIGIGSIDNTMLKDFAASRSNALMSFFKNKISRKSNIPKEENEKLDYKLASCCNPIPGDEVFGFVTVAEGIKVHKKNCPNALSLQSNYAYRIIQAKWVDSTKQEFTASIIISGIDHMGLVNEV